MHASWSAPSDFADLERQVLRELSGAREQRAVIAPGSILLARDLTPSQLIDIDTARWRASRSMAGGPTSHVAILAGTLGIPMLVSIGPALSEAVGRRRADPRRRRRHTACRADGDGTGRGSRAPRTVARPRRARTRRRRTRSAISPAASASKCSRISPGPAPTRNTPRRRAPKAAGCCAPNSCSSSAPRRPTKPNSCAATSSRRSARARGRW